MRLCGLGLHLRCLASVGQKRGLSIRDKAPYFNDYLLDAKVLENKGNFWYLAEME